MVDSEQREQESKPVRSGPERSLNGHAGGGIMIVEDEVILAEMTRRLLIRWGYEVVAVVSSGEAAVQQAEISQPDLIVMDIRLAGEMDGFEAARRINQDRSVPVIFTTGYSDDVGDEVPAETRGVSVTLSKPIPPPSLKAVVEHLLDS